MKREKQLTVNKITPRYWTVTFNNPPLNMFDPWTFAELNVLMDDIEASDELHVIVFESGNPDFFMDHHNVTERVEVPDVPGAKPFFFEWPNWVERLANSPVISIAKVRGRCWAQGFEFALACDLRFASKEKAHFALIEAAGVSMPGGGGIEWLSALCGRSRAIEIVCSADDYDADRGELYGFVNRALPDDELDGYTDAFARRIAGFNMKSLTLCKKNINARAGVPSQADLFESNYILRSIDFWPEAIEAGKKMAAGDAFVAGDVELDLPKVLPVILGDNQ